MVSTKPVGVQVEVAGDDGEGGVQVDVERDG